MSLGLRKVTLEQLPKVHHEPTLGLRLERGAAIYAAKIYAEGRNEPVSTRIKGRFAVRAGKERFEGAGEAVITRHRLLLRITSGMGSKGFGGKKGINALVSAARADLGAAIPVNARGKIKRVEMSGASEAFQIEMQVGNFANFIEAMTPEYAATKLGEERWAELEAKRHATEQAERHATEQAAEEQKRRNAERFAGAASRTGAAVTLRGLGKSVFDHRRTWRYRLAARPEQCIDGFAAAFSGKGGLLLKGKWKIARTPTGATATYGGRKGVVAIGSLMSETARNEEQGAIGSEVRFEIEEAETEYTICAMWLASHGSRVGFVNDGRFFRPYMRAVESHLRALDAQLQLVKS